MRVISEHHPDILKIACQSLQDGNVIAFATDTVYGVACDASNADAVHTLFEIKNRDARKPVAIFPKDVLEAKEIFLFDETSTKIAEQLLPGNITLILQKNPASSIQLAPNLNEQNDSLGFRLIHDDFTNALISEFSGILAVSSANPSNEKPATTSKEVENYFQNSKLDVVVDKKTPQSSHVSTVIKVENNKAVILRDGAVSQNAINLVLNK